jgi:hypothetical protein
MANTVLLVFDGHPMWFQSVNTREQILAIYDYIEAILAGNGYLPPPALADNVFDFYTRTHQQGVGTGWAWDSSPALRELPADFPLVHATNIALPEFGGRIITVPISLKENTLAPCSRSPSGQNSCTR